MLEPRLSLSCDETGCSNRVNVIATTDENGAPELLFEEGVDPNSWNNDIPNFWLCPGCYEARQQRQSVSAPAVGRRKMNLGAPSPAPLQVPAPAPAPMSFAQAAPQVQMQQQAPAPVAARPVHVAPPQSQQTAQAPMTISAPMTQNSPGVQMAAPTAHNAKPPITIAAPMSQPPAPNLQPPQMAPSQGGYLAPVPLQEMPVQFEVPKLPGQ